MQAGSGYSVVWFKRDLRIHDHPPLAQAAQRGPVLCLYVIEPSVWGGEDAAAQHYGFILESLRALYRALAARGARLHVVTGEVVEVLARLHAAAPFDALYSHEETGNALTYARDLAVGRWCAAQGVRWRETPQFGVVRRLRDRDHWQAHWEQWVGLSQTDAPTAVHGVDLPWPAGSAPAPTALGLDPASPPSRQRGGRPNGEHVLAEFLDERCGQYRGGISSPLSAPSACSRLSPYLAYGCLSLREIVQATRERVAALSEPDLLRAGMATTDAARRARAGLEAFESRLAWHCHFIQKLESEPEIEWRNVHRGYDGLREDGWHDAHFAALVAGRTGWPLVDACVAMLRETGWINFRMRAMLVSVAAYPLWLHWRPVGLWLARQFLDYEPGIHWSQMQMQSGTTGINVPRIYNPVKQARDHDPQGRFVRRWLPWMRKVPDSWLFEPWRMPADLRARHGLADGELPEPLVDLDAATRAAKARLFARRADPAVRAAKAAVVERHGSRRRTATGTRRATRSDAVRTQLALDL